MIFRKLALVCSSAFLAACSLPPVPETWTDARRGEQVARVCIGANETRWSKLDSNSMLLVVEKEKKEDFYELELYGACKLKRSALSINLDSDPASECLEVSAAEATDSCVVRKIYRWNPDAGPPAISTAYNSPRS